MSRPQKHPRTGVYWFRMRVPADLVSVVGRKEVTRSLQTKDPAEARTRYLQVRSEFDTRWVNLRSGPSPISEREAHELAVSFYVEWIEIHAENPSQQTFWNTKVGGALWSRDPANAAALPSYPGFDFSPNLALAFRFAPHAELEGWCREKARSFLTSKGLEPSADNETTMARAIGAAIQRASLLLEERSQGRSSIGSGATSSLVQPVHREAELARQQGAATTLKDTQPENSLTSLIEDWWREAKATGRKPSTYESYRNTFRTLIAFLGHDDASRVGRRDVVAFKDHRLATPSARTGKIPSPKTVKDSDLSALKAVFEWAVINGRMEENPAATVSLKLAKQRKLREKGFTDEEAKAILTAAVQHSSDRELFHTSAAKRWVPWICAFTGARVGEIAQLRREDITQRDGHWIVRITPEAGTVKTNEARGVVLHPQIIDLGFDAFIANAPAGHLFVRVKACDDVLGPLQGLKNRLSAFARAVVPDPNVAPFHGWRHRFKTVGMEVGIPPRVLDAIQGHAPRSVSDAYGHVTLKTIAQAIVLLPAFNLDPSMPSKSTDDPR